MTIQKRVRPKVMLTAILAVILCITYTSCSILAAESVTIGSPTASGRKLLPECYRERPAPSASDNVIPVESSALISEGKASYYASHFHGKKTSSGEIFNLNHFTAAHRTLPFGTNVKIINLNNGKNVFVRINDRGPHLRGRIIDVSPAAAKEIGLFGRGTANVRIESYN